ncbi:MAG: hypothetical protein QXP70_05365 [Methanomassiliicoccales archaeon]
MKLKSYRCQRCGSTDTQVTHGTGFTVWVCRKCGLTRTRRRIQQCPVCGSTELYYEAGLITGQKYHCSKCDYIGPLVFERDIEDISG